MVQSLNLQVELAVKANSFYNPISPKQGVMALGDKGIEFRASSGAGYIQIPWENIVQVRAQVLLGKYIRGFDIYTDDQQRIEFVAEDAKAALRVMREHIGGEKLVRAKSNLKGMLRRKKAKQ